MNSSVPARCRALDLAASIVIPVWMLLFSALALNTHYALSGLTAEGRAAELRIEELERRIAELGRRIEGPAGPNALPGNAPRDPAPTPTHRRME